MTKASDLELSQRLLLLISAIANNPGIASSRDSASAGIDPMQLLQQEMMIIAAESGMEYKQCSPATLRKNIAVLKRYGILPSKTRVRSGYAIGHTQQLHAPTPRQPEQRKCKLTAKEIGRLKEQGLTFQAIGDRAGVSRSRVHQIYRMGLS